MSTFAKQLSMDDFDYPLPDVCIAQQPLESRDSSKLLICDGKNIKESVFNEISSFLPDNALLLTNNTRVIQARLMFRKETGATIEIFCLEPITPTRDIQSAFAIQGQATWKCLVGNAKKWKTGKLSMNIDVDGVSSVLYAEKGECVEDAYYIQFSWDPSELRFAEVIENAGLTPLPPYISRDADASDKDSYQTIFALNNGSVAAPTAGLHFTPEVMSALENKGIQQRGVTLHVSAGTFKPVKCDSPSDHVMHNETISISTETIKEIINNIDKNIIAVGTTTVRTIESLYWHGVKLIVDVEKLDNNIEISQWDPYNPDYDKNISVIDSLTAILERAESDNDEMVSGYTQLMIVPGYQFRIPNILITNFHQPRSTLLLLVSAFIGNIWRTAYDYAVKQNFRFLSYGDSCLFIRNIK